MKLQLCYCHGSVRGNDHVCNAGRVRGNDLSVMLAVSARLEVLARLDLSVTPAASVDDCQITLVAFFSLFCFVEIFWR